MGKIYIAVCVDHRLSHTSQISISSHPSILHCHRRVSPHSTSIVVVQQRSGQVICVDTTSSSATALKPPSADTDDAHDHGSYFDLEFTLPDEEEEAKIKDNEDEPEKSDYENERREEVSEMMRGSRDEKRERERESENNLGFGCGG